MADNITEADQLIIQLLAALNSTIGSYTASQELDNSDATANQLALTALVVSLIALVVALLQAVLEYMSSNSAQGEKCNTGAIGEYARVSGTRKWSWRHWRRQYFYPELNLNLFNVQGSIHDVKNSEVGNVFKGFKDLFPARLDTSESMGYFSWCYFQILDYSNRLPDNAIRNGRHHLYRRVEMGWRLVLPQNLPMTYRLKWFRYLLFRRHREEITPRATWAQMLTLLNVDSKNMCTSRLRGADCIPSTLDVPAQKVQLTDLGIFAFCLGFDKVEISTQDRTILATGEVGTITTESLPGFGAVVRFQILSPRPQHFVPAYEAKFALEDHRNQLLGLFNLGSGGGTVPRDNWLRDFFTLDSPFPGVHSARCSTIADEAKQWLGVAEMVQGHASSNIRETDLFPEYLAAWRARQDVEIAGGIKRWPSILLAASFACLPETTTGFPSSALLRPFLQVFQHMSRSLPTPPGAIWENLHDLHEWTMVLQLLQGDYCRVRGHEDLTDQEKSGHFSWLYNELDLIDLVRVEKILLSRVPTIDLSGLWPHHLERRQPRFRARRVVNIQPNRTSRKGAPNTSDPGDHSPRLGWGRLLPHTVELFKSFDPVSWATSMRSQNPLKRKPGQGETGWRNHVQPENAIWTQVYLLDIAISKILCEYVKLKPNVPDTVGKVLVECWEDPKADAPLQCLDKFLCREFFSDDGSEEQIEQMRALADMIKVRTLCYIAYMMVIPDSTSLYEASLKGPVVLPMI